MSVEWSHILLIEDEQICLNLLWITLRWQDERFFFICKELLLFYFLIEVQWFLFMIQLCSEIYVVFVSLTLKKRKYMSLKEAHFLLKSHVEGMFFFLSPMTTATSYHCSLFSNTNRFYKTKRAVSIHSQETVPILKCCVLQINHHLHSLKSDRTCYRLSCSKATSLMYNPSQPFL